MTSFETLPDPSPIEERVLAFALQPLDAPPQVRAHAALLLLDALGVGAAAAKLPAARIVRDHAARYWAAGDGAPSAALPFDGRTASPPGAAFAFASQIDNLDAHDGWQPSRGHAGAALIPALLAAGACAPGATGRDAVDALIVGYEIACRAATSLHATVTDYHTSGAWNAIGAAAIAARLTGLDANRTRHALGIAEYHGPRSQMMREIANPTMLHDGSGVGAAVGVMSALLAADGFRGAPAATIAFADVEAHWSDLGARWVLLEQYVKPYPICRWAHAPIDAAVRLAAERPGVADEVETIEIDTFAYAAALRLDAPRTTEAAQYAMAWPVAAALLRGRCGVDEVLEPSFSDPEIRRLVTLTTARVDPELDAAYPDRRLARVTVRLRSGETWSSGVVEASGGPEPRPDAPFIRDKFAAYAAPALGPARARALEQACLALDDADAPFDAFRAVCSEPMEPDAVPTP